MIISLTQRLHALLERSRAADFLAPLLLRLYLAPIFWIAGSSKLADMDGTIAWFGNSAWGIGLPFPALLAWLAALSESVGAVERLELAKGILHEHGHYEWLTDHGSFVVLNNGIEFAATYIIMLLALFFLGGGRYLSIDYWLRRHFTKGLAASQRQEVGPC